jgi:hypothetical protein
MLALFASFGLRLFERSASGHVRLDEAARAEDDVLVLPGRRSEVRVPLRTLTSGWVLETRSRRERIVVVELFTDEGDVWRVRVADVEQGLWFLAACGVDAKQRKIRIERTRSDGFDNGFLLGVVVSVIACPFYGWALQLLDSPFGFVVLPTVLVAFWRARGRVSHLGPLEIGVDGVAWSDSPAKAKFAGRLFARLRGTKRRFVAWRDVKSVTVRALDLWLDTRDGMLRVPLGTLGSEMRQMVVRRIDDARERERNAESLELFEPRGRSFAAWVEELGALDDGQGYRAAAVPKVRVLETLEDPDAPRGRRLGAALALVLSDDEDTRAMGRHLARTMAASVVDEKLAKALDALAEERIDEKLVMQAVEPS